MTRGHRGGLRLRERLLQTMAAFYSSMELSCLRNPHGITMATQSGLVKEVPGSRLLAARQRRRQVPASQMPQQFSTCQLMHNHRRLVVIVSASSYPAPKRSSEAKQNPKPLVDDLDLGRSMSFLRAACWPRAGSFGLVQLGFGLLPLFPVFLSSRGGGAVPRLAARECTRRTAK